MLVTALAVLLLAARGGTTSECLNCTPERPCDTRAAIALALASYHVGGRNCTRLTLSSAHGMCSQLNTMLDALLRWNSVAADATLAPLSSAGWSIVNAVGHGGRRRRARARACRRASTSTPRGAARRRRGSASSSPCAARDADRRAAAARARPFFDFVAGLARRAAAGRRARGRDRGGARRARLPRAAVEHAPARARVVSVHLRRRDKLGGAKDAPARATSRPSTRPRCARPPTRSTRRTSSSAATTTPTRSAACARVLPTARRARGRCASSRARRRARRRARAGAAAAAALFLLAEGDYLVASFGSHVARLLLPLVAARHCGPLWPRGYPLFADLDRLISVENVTERRVLLPPARRAPAPAADALGPRGRRLRSTAPRGGPPRARSPRPRPPRSASSRARAAALRGGRDELGRGGRCDARSNVSRALSSRSLSPAPLRLSLSRFFPHALSGFGDHVKA